MNAFPATSSWQLIPPLAETVNFVGAQFAALFFTVRTERGRNTWWPKTSRFGKSLRPRVCNERVFVHAVGRSQD